MSSAAITELEVLDPSLKHAFSEPKKKIHTGEDVLFFLTSKAYKDLVRFLLQLNASMFPRKDATNATKYGSVSVWELGSSAVVFSPVVKQLVVLLSKLGDILSDAPPETGPRRYGNVSFRKWFDLVESRSEELLEQHLPEHMLKIGGKDGQAKGALTELRTYLLGSLGSPQRLDYGTGHEVSFLAFLGCIWKLGGFGKAESGVEERGIVLGVIVPYLRLVRNLIKTYNLEPAGSHGVWGLDDHSFLPYIFGSAQLGPALVDTSHIPQEGSLPNAPDPADVAKASVVERERKVNMYFEAVGFIYDVKKGPFWEHSPMLYDISGVKAGWAKINKGMLKMYDAEVLSKFPVVQHFKFGSLFRWEQDPQATIPKISQHVASQPAEPKPTKPSEFPIRQGLPSGTTEFVGTAAPWAVGRSFVKDPATVAPRSPLNVPTKPYILEASSTTSDASRTLSQPRAERTQATDVLSRAMLSRELPAGLPATRAPEG